MTQMSEYYGIKNIEEAIEYLHDETLSNRLIEISKALLELEVDNDIKDIMGFPDNLKLRSSMTLFKKAEELSDIKYDNIFQKVLDKYYNGEEDNITLNILEKNSFKKIVENEIEDEDNKKENHKKDDKDDEQNNMQKIDLDDKEIRNRKINENESIEEYIDINNIDNNINSQQENIKKDFIQTIATSITIDLNEADLNGLEKTENENKNEEKKEREKIRKDDDDDDDDEDKCCQLKFLQCIIS